jgi:hypothetical protein
MTSFTFKHIDDPKQGNVMKYELRNHSYYPVYKIYLDVIRFKSIISTSTPFTYLSPILEYVDNCI